MAMKNIHDLATHPDGGSRAHTFIWSPCKPFAQLLGHTRKLLPLLPRSNWHHYSHHTVSGCGPGPSLGSGMQTGGLLREALQAKAGRICLACTRSHCIIDTNTPFTCTSIRNSSCCSKPYQQGYKCCGLSQQGAAWQSYVTLVPGTTQKPLGSHM